MQVHSQGSKDVLIRPMCAADIENIANNHCPPWSTVQETRDRWTRFYRQQQDKIRTVGVVDKDGEILGYGSLLLKSEYPRFFNIPEINDLWIFAEHRKIGLGTQLISWLENLAIGKGFKEIGIGVGLYADYGAAQKLYIHLGYTPDGHGITYKGLPVVPGKTYPVDDELILWLTKSLEIKDI